MELDALAPVPGVTHRDVRVGDVRLHVAEAGAGPPLLLVHGWPQHWWAWRRMIPRLAEDYRVIAPDLRGWGWSDAPPGDYAKATFAADLLALLDAEGLERVSIVGHDWGGHASFLLALEHPQRVARLVALDVPPPWPGRPSPGLVGLPVMMAYQVVLATPGLGRLVMTRGPEFIRGIIRAGSGRHARWTGDELDAYAEVLCQPARAEASARCYRTFLTRELPAAARRGDRSEELDVPTLLIMGGASPLQRVLAPRPSRNLRVEVIPGAGHFLPEEAPDEVLALAAPFLAVPTTPGPAASR
jgi:pimeloyl-ACP methyl ester carboxylesterase